MDLELLKCVESDLCFLQEKWNQSIDDDSLRRSSNVLRLLLVNGALQKAWIEAGFTHQPKITAPTLNHLFPFLFSERIPTSHIKFAQAGGAKVNSGSAICICVLDIALTDSQTKALYDLGINIQVLNLSAFIEAPCIYTNGIPINRRELIKYIANKLGGAHYDPQRDTTKEDGIKFSELDNIRKTMITLDKNSIFFELLSIGQSLNQSNDIQALRNKIKSCLADNCIFW